MNLRQTAYFALFGLRGQALGTYYKRILREDQHGIPPDQTDHLLVKMLTHCKQSVPYYGRVIRKIGDSFHEDPKEYLKNFPILTKETIRNRFDELKSSDLPGRKWYFNTSGGSTGEPVRFIQDWEYAVRSGAITLLYSKLIGREIGELEAYLWGSERDIIQGNEKIRARLINKLTNTIFLNAFNMTPARMREFITVLNSKRPKLIVAYAQSIYELAKFSEHDGLEVIPQTAIITSAGTLYPFMREQIEKVFKCRVFNRYGSREVYDIACERPGWAGLWVAPWGNFIEIVDRDGNRLPDGTEGEILVTLLTNFAMPLVRYRIGDRGVLSPRKKQTQVYEAQVLERVIGRTVDTFKIKQGTLIDGEYFTHLLYFKDWVWKFQVVQKNYSHILFRIVKSSENYGQAELDEITGKTRLVMGNDCKVEFEFLGEIPPSPSGKFRYTISEVQPSQG
jgi:phenylacetate-CoA ligase